MGFRLILRKIIKFVATRCAPKGPILLRDGRGSSEEWERGGGRREEIGRSGKREEGKGKGRKGG